MLKHTMRILLFLAVMTGLSACGASGAGETPAALPPLEQAPTEQPGTPPVNYPAPESALPQATTPSAGYPAPPTLPPTVDPYPGGEVWVMRPMGIQCEEGTLPGYGDLRETKSTLTAAGIQVEEVEIIEMMVTTSCGSPTSAHYHARIAAGDLETALSLGWSKG